jgi:hypothetical protein
VSTATIVTIAVTGSVALLALLAFLRVLLRREGPAWRRLRVGVFVERDAARGEDERES